MDENKSTESESNYSKQIDQADTIITKAWNLLKRHWGKLLIFLLLYGSYQFFILLGKELEKPEVTTEPEQSVYVVREYIEYYEDNTSAIIQVWNDSTETVKP